MGRWVVGLTKLHVCPGHYGTVVGSRVRGRSRDARPGVSSLLPVTCYLLSWHYRLVKSTTPVLQCSHARSASTAVSSRPTTAVSRPWTRYARRDFARKMGFSGPNGPHRKPPLRGGMLRMSWRYAPWSTRLVRFQQPAAPVGPNPPETLRDLHRDLSTRQDVRDGCDQGGR